MKLPFALPVALFISGVFSHVTGRSKPVSDNDSLQERRLPNTRSRITAGQVVYVMDRLGDRDQAIMATVGRVRVASARQLERIHFTDSTPLSNARSARATLARLAGWRVLARLDRRVGGVRSGSAGYAYSLDVVGQRVLDRDRLGGGHFRRPWTPLAPFLDHALAVTELYVRLLEAERQGRLQVLAFDAEPGCWRASIGPAGERVVLKPDAFVRIGTGEFEELAFIEVDRGTESTRALGLKFDRYRAYWASGREQQSRGVFPRVLWLVAASERRYQQLVDVAVGQPPDAWQLFHIARFADAVSALIGEGDG